MCTVPPAASPATATAPTAAPAVPVGRCQVPRLFAALSPFNYSMARTVLFAPRMARGSCPAACIA
eukprot:3296356-Lingulodinium_polyedra.AAC.1